MHFSDRRSIHEKSTFFATLCLSSLFGADDIVGFWKSVDENSGLARCIVAVYAHEGVRYGRIIATMNEEEKIKDSIYKPVERAPGVVGDPFYSGLDIIWNLEDRGSSFKGKILDPENGKVYNAELWTEEGELNVRGKLLFFFRTQVWLPVKESEFKDFKRPDVSKFIPVIPEVK